MGNKRMQNSGGGVMNVEKHIIGPTYPFKRKIILPGSKSGWLRVLQLNNYRFSVGTVREHCIV